VAEDDQQGSGAPGTAGGQAAMPVEPASTAGAVALGTSTALNDPTTIPPWYPKVLALTFVGLTIWLGLYALLGHLRSLIIWLLVALFLSFAIEPAVNWFARHGWKRGLGTAFVLFMFALLGLGLVAAMVPLIIDQIRELVEKLPGWIEGLRKHSINWFGFKFDTNDIDKAIAKLQENLDAANIAKNVFSLVATGVGLIFQLLTIGLFTFYLVADGPRFRRTVCSFMSPARQMRVINIWEVAIDKTGGYLYSRLLLALFSGIWTFIWLTILGVPFAAALALWMGLISQFIPVVGTYIAMFLPILVALAQSPVTALIVLIVFLVYQQIENYWLGPKITSKTMQLHPAVAFGSAIVGGSVLGAVGAFLALPAAAIIQAILSTYLERHKVIETDLTSDEPAPPDEKPASKPKPLERAYRRIRDRRSGSTGDVQPATGDS
jgi:predicted PurR-regulated permease PerM